MANWVGASVFRGLLDEVMRINEEQRNRFLAKWTAHCALCAANILACLAWHSKEHHDIRESPAIVIVQSLLQQ